ncbi:transposase [Streptomyces sp. NPDC057798]|uniref:transposase n=1 Tax=Streptomyces sp. NPDC057798 TaxID=3346252 RepID=UPI003697C74D
MPLTRVTADAAYGQEGFFRRPLEQSGLGYVLAVPSASRSWAQASTTFRAGPPARHGSQSRAAKAPRVFRSATGRHWNCPRCLSSTPRGKPPSAIGGPWPAAASANLWRSPDSAPTLPRRPRWPTWCGSPVCAGRSRSAPKPGRKSEAWTSTRSAAIRAGIDTSPWP